MRRIDIIGQRSGMLVAVSECEKVILPSGQAVRRVKCLCDCGNTKEVMLYHFNHGKTKSCGCLAKTRNGESTTKIYKRYRGMINRCSSKHIEPHLYHDRGIYVCDEWLCSFESFKKWALLNGYSDKLQIDRIDNNKGYSPDNCRFVTPSENMRNKRVSFMLNINGVSIHILDAIQKYNPSIKYATVISRIKRGWDHFEAVNKPARKLNKRIGLY
jgi:hypothetical protein